MDSSEEITLLKSHLAQLEEKVIRQRRELDSLKKQVSTLQEIVDELEHQLGDDEP